MGGSIFLIQGDGGLVPMSERPYDSEDLLQRLLAEYPDILAGDQMNSEEPRRWLLVSREVAVPDAEGGAGRWALDHLFLDQDGIPTLVEVKRSTDTRIRREVVGQLLDYAANAVMYWPLDSIRGQFEMACIASGRVPEAAVQELVGPEGDTEAFWQLVQDNLRTGRVRLVIVADMIPTELQRIVEFLNGQMSPAELLAVEVRQYVGQQLRTLVPRVVGLTAAAQQRRQTTAARNRHNWDEAAVFAALEQSCTPEGVVAVRKLFDFVRTRGVGFSWGHGAYPSVSARFLVNGKPVSVWTCYASVNTPTLEVAFRNMRGPVPTALLQRLAGRLRQLPGVGPRIAGLEQADFRKGPNLPVDQVLAQPGFVEGFEAALTELLESS